MQAIVMIAGSQFRVKEGDTVVVPHLSGDINADLTFNDVVATFDDQGAITVGTGSVNAQVLEHGRGATVLVFHKKRRKGYQKLNGHRQPYTRIRITGVKA